MKFINTINFLGILKQITTNLGHLTQDIFHTSGGKMSRKRVWLACSCPKL